MKILCLFKIIKEDLEKIKIFSSMKILKIIKIYYNLKQQIGFMKQDNGLM
jgi:hypothetical protein